MMDNMAEPKKEITLSPQDWELVYEALKQAADDLGDDQLEDIADAIKEQLK
jgi:hypothetical protein